MMKENTVLGGRYEIIEKIGIGGMADVYKGTDRVLKRSVAIKVLKSEFREDEAFVKKFRSEAQAAAGLEHPNIVNIYDVAEDRGMHYIVMELVEGITLKEYIQKKGKLTPKEVIGITMQVCSGIDAAHTNNIIHRDIKPQNIMISKEGKVKVTDFGIAKATSSNTISTNVMGSVHYTSPEQARGGFSDAKSDIYSLGITMYEMITGQLPFDGDTTVSIALKHLQEDIVEPSQIVPDIPYSLEQIILKCTQKSPDRRYNDIAMLARDLKRSLQEPNGNFVRIVPIAGGAEAEMAHPHGQGAPRGNARYRDDYEDYDDYDDYYAAMRGRRRPPMDHRYEEESRMSSAMKTVVTVALCLILGLMAVGGFFLWQELKDRNSITEPDTKYIVPNMVGMTLEEAKKACEKEGLGLEVVDDEQEHLEYEAGYVYRQTTQAGTSMPEGTKIQVYVSAGLKNFEVPDVLGEKESMALSLLKQAGFKEASIEVEEEEHDTVRSGRVIRLSIKPGTMVNSKERIIVYVSKGLGERTVPQLVGKTESVAQQLLQEAELVGQVKYETSTLAAGIVISQDIEAEEIVTKGTIVVYTVSLGNTITLPNDLVGKTFAEVKQILEGLELKVHRSDVSTVVETEGEVVGIVAGSTLKPGDLVVVEVGTVPEPEPTPTDPDQTEDPDQTGNPEGSGNDQGLE